MYGLFQLKKMALAMFVMMVGLPGFTVSAWSEEAGSQFHRFWPDNLFAVDFINENTGYIGGYSGTLLRTGDGGKSWDALYVGKNELIRRVSFVDEKQGWAIGHRGSIFHTVDGGKNWVVQKQLEGIYLRDISFVDGMHGWVVGHQATILYTEDGGKNWISQQLSGFEGRDIPRLHGIYARDVNNAILVGEFGVIAHTENAGELWAVTPVNTNVTWLSIAGSKEGIYTVGLDGTAAYLTVATASQREAIDQEVAKRRAKKEAKARRKAKRLKREYIPQPFDNTVRSDVEYVVNAIDTKTNEHLFDASITSEGGAVVVGRSTVLYLNKKTVENFIADETLPLDYLWFGGVAVTPQGSVWASGIRGLVVKGELSGKTFSPALNLGVSENINLVNSRWAHGH